MYNDKIYLTPQEILEKEFKIDTRGYRPQDVDKFLDMIIRDYTEYNSIIKNLQTEIKNLTEDNTKLKQEILSMQEEFEFQKNNSQQSSKTTNVDLLQRISNLEKVVFGKEE